MTCKIKSPFRKFDPITIIFTITWIGKSKKNNENREKCFNALKTQLRMHIYF